MYNFSLKLIIVIIVAIMYYMWNLYSSYYNFITHEVDANISVKIAMEDAEYGTKLAKYMTEKDMNERLYDKVIIGYRPSNFREWLKLRKTDIRICSIEENTMKLKADDVVVTNGIFNDVQVYCINELKFLAYDELNIITNVHTDLEIQYPEDQKKDDIIKDYTVVYQKEKKD